MAALGLVHVVGGDHHRQPAGGEGVDLVPEVAPRLGVHAGGGLVQQQEARLVQHRGRERQPLLPAAGQRTRGLFPARFQPQLRQRLRHPPRAVAHAVDAGDEEQVLLDGQVLVEREPLRHVAGEALDLAGPRADVEAEAGALAAVGRQQPAQHPHGGGLAGAVGAEEAGGAPFLHRDGDVAHHTPAAEALVEAAHVDRSRHGVSPPAPAAIRPRAGRARGPPAAPGPPPP